MTRASLGSAVSHGAIISAMSVSLVAAPAFAQSVDLSKWSPEYVRAIAGTEEFDTVGHCNAVTPTDYTGKLTFWYQGVFEGDPQVMRDNYTDFFKAFAATYPNIELDAQGITYNELLDKFRTALLGNAAPMAIRL